MGSNSLGRGGFKRQRLRWVRIAKAEARAASAAAVAAAAPAAAAAAAAAKLEKATATRFLSVSTAARRVTWYVKIVYNVV